MYGFPDKDKLKDLFGKEIVQVCLGRRQVCLIMESSESITITSADKFFKDNLDIITNGGGQIPILENLLSSRIVDIVIESAHTARLVLDNGCAIIIQDDDEKFETITFNFSDGYVVV